MTKTKRGKNTYKLRPTTLFNKNTLVLLVALPLVLRRLASYPRDNFLPIPSISYLLFVLECNLFQLLSNGRIDPPFQKKNNLN